MKKCFALVTAALMTLLCFNVSPVADAAVSSYKKANINDLVYQYDADLGGVEITGYEGKESYITFPSTIDGDRVVSINIRPYLEPMTEKLYEVEIPKGVKSVKISYCKNLEKIKLPESLKELHEGAFCGDGKVRSISLPKNMTEISKSAFSGCGSLCEINMPGVKKIGSGAFSNCDSLTEVSILKNVEYVGGDAFSACDNLGKITLSNKCKYIGWSAFSQCESLTEVTIPSINYPYNDYYDQSSSTYIGRKAKDGYSKLDGIDGATFAGCYNLKKVTTYSYISEQEFYDCKSLKEVIVIPNKSDKRYYIGPYAFRDCTSLKTVDLSKVKKPMTIGRGAFENCTSLRSLKLPNDCVIGDKAFDDCKALTVTYKGKKYTHKNFDQLYKLCKRK